MTVLGSWRVVLFLAALLFTSAVFSAAAAAADADVDGVVFEEDDAAAAAGAGARAGAGDAVASPSVSASATAAYGDADANAGGSGAADDAPSRVAEGAAADTAAAREAIGAAPAAAGAAATATKLWGFLGGLEVGALAVLALYGAYFVQGRAANGRVGAAWGGAARALMARQFATVGESRASAAAEGGAASGSGSAASPAAPDGSVREGHATWRLRCAGRRGGAAAAQVTLGAVPRHDLASAVLGLSGVAGAAQTVDEVAFDVLLEDDTREKAVARAVSGTGNKGKTKDGSSGGADAVPMVSDPRRAFVLAVCPRRSMAAARSANADLSRFAPVLSEAVVRTRAAAGLPDTLAVCAEHEETVNALLTAEIVKLVAACEEKGAPLRLLHVSDRNIASDAFAHSLRVVVGLDKKVSSAVLAAPAGGAEAIDAMMDALDAPVQLVGALIDTLDKVRLGKAARAKAEAARAADLPAPKTAAERRQEAMEAAQERKADRLREERQRAQALTDPAARERALSKIEQREQKKSQRKRMKQRVVRS